MSTLTNQQIKDTYQGLIKTSDNAAIGATEKALEDGLGNALPLTVGTGGISFNAGVDFSAATVTGLDAGGLVEGTGAGAMKSADFLVESPATASGQDSIALGTGCSATALASLVIGRNSQATGTASTALGNSASATADQSIAISGENISVSAQRSVGIGRQSNCASANSITIGNFAVTTLQAPSSIVLSSSTTSASSVGAASSLVLTPGGFGGKVGTGNDRTISIGVCSSSATQFKANADDAIAIGTDAVANADGSVALGLGVTAAKANTTTVNKLEVKAVGGSITMYSPDGTEWLLTVTDAGVLSVTAAV